MPSSQWTGFWTLVERECLRFVRLWGQTVAPPVILTVLFIVIFGYSLGARIREIGGYPYIIYILPGLACMGIINNAFANCTTSLFVSRMDRSIENVLVSPISPVQIVTAYVIGGASRGILVGLITFAVAMPLTELTITSYLWGLLFMFLISITFASTGIITALWARDWDSLSTITNFVITPAVYLGGVFYSIKMLPPVWQQVSALNPLFYMIDGLRWAVLGGADFSLALNLTITLGFAILTFLTAVCLFSRGYKLIV